ncbi:MAG: phosphate ABC transporter permease subunit PstC [Bacteroidales bacterium]
MLKLRLLLKYFLERIIRILITISGYTTSFVILLIILFLFKDSIALFNQPIVDSGYELVIRADNPIKKLSPEKIMRIFDTDIDNWSEAGGKDLPIFVYRFTDLTEDYEGDVSLTQNQINDSLFLLFENNPGIICFLPRKQDLPDNAYIVPTGDIDPEQFFFGKYWYPTITPVAQYGLLPLFMGTLWVSIGAILIALPFSLAVAIYMAELADKRLRRWLKPVIELLAGIPSVVYGFFGLVVIVPSLQKIFRLPVGETALAGSLVLAIMALPTIITVAEDAIRTTPRAMKEASMALGATHWQTIRKVILPYAKSGIASAIVLGIGRAIGETMAVLMVTGNAAVIPTSFLEPVRTIPATIAAEMGEAAVGSAHYEALFALGAVLFVITLGLSIAVEYISKNKY